METQTPPRFEFTIEGLPPDCFTVARFKGQEGLSQLYEFDILLASRESTVDLDAVRSGKARLTMLRPGKQELIWSGIVLDFDQMEQNHGYTFYRAVMVPRAWWLTQITSSQIFLDDEMHHILSTILSQAGLAAGVDYEFRLAMTYPRRDWICQYDETHWNFFNRLMERGGVYFFFEQTPAGEKLVVTDSFLSHVPLPGEEGLEYHPPSGLDAPQALEAARSFRCSLRQVPKEVVIRDYNYRNLVQVEARCSVNKGGVATLYRHVEDLRSNAEARYVAKARAEGIACRGSLYHGETAAPFLRPGYSFSLSGHYRDDFNQQYTTLELSHEGHQEAYILSRDSQAKQDRPPYRNTFTAISASQQFRPAPNTPRPVVAGPIIAWIDGEGDGQYAEMDSMGRYKVRFPFDLSGRKDGNASHWIRLLTPYGGQAHGMHLPLHKGTEVLVVFRDGNPDKPVIAGAVPNQVQKMAVTQDTATQCRLTTAGGNLLHMEDRQGKQGIMLSSPTQGSYLQIGSPELAANYTGGTGTGSVLSQEGHTLFTNGWFSLKAQESSETILGNKNSMVIGLLTDTVIGGRVETSLLGKFECGYPWIKVLTPEMMKMTAELKHLSGEVTTITAEQTKMTGEINKLTTSEHKMNGTLSVLVTEKNRIATVVNNLCETTQDISDEVYHVRGMTTTIQNQVNTVEASINKVVSDQNEMFATKNQLGEQLDIINTSMHTISMDVNEIVDTINSISSSKVDIAADYTIL